jgi:hypothetical protein
MGLEKRLDQLEQRVEERAESREPRCEQTVRVQRAGEPLPESRCACDGPHILVRVVGPK